MQKYKIYEKSILNCSLRAGIKVHGKNYIVLLIGEFLLVKGKRKLKEE